MGQLREVIDKAARTLFKSLGGLLALQERIAERWVAAQQPVPVPTPQASEPTAEASSGGKSSDVA